MRKKNPNFSKDHSNRESDSRRESNRPKSRTNRSETSKSSDKSERKSFRKKSNNRSGSRGRENGPNTEKRGFNPNDSENSSRKSFIKNRTEGSSTKEEYSGNGDRRAKKSFDGKPKDKGRFGKNAGEKRGFAADRSESTDKKSFDRKSFAKGKFKGKSDEEKFVKGKSDYKKNKPHGDRKRPDFNKFRNKRNAKINEKPDDGLIRLNKYVANAGICSRRQADEYIRTGLVEVNGTVITEMGYKVKAEDDVRFDGQRISPEKKVYLLLNKPKGFITTTSDERDRKTVMDLVANATTSRLFPVGRLDRQTTGVLLFTNDGHMAKKLTHPSHNIKKIYHVVLDKNLHGDDMGKIREGIRMEEGIAKVDKISFIEGKAHNEVGVEIHIGWNRVVRRIFEKLGYKIEHLDRVQFAGLTKKNVKRGDWRMLDGKEVNFLQML